MLPESPRRLPGLLGVGLLALGVFGFLVVWHLIRRGRLIREGLSPRAGFAYPPWNRPGQGPPVRVPRPSPSPSPSLGPSPKPSRNENQDRYDSAPSVVPATPHDLDSTGDLSTVRTPERPGGLPSRFEPQAFGLR